MEAGRHLNARVDAGFRVRLVKPIDRRTSYAPLRCLTAILAADVAGYSRLMGADEEGTHEQLRAHLRELIEPKIAEHRVRVVKNTGDGMLVEFPSVVDAVRCAVDLQRGMVERNAAIPASERIEFRNASRGWVEPSPFSVQKGSTRPQSAARCFLSR
jgi:class 3 adenylate cyclase